MQRRVFLGALSAAMSSAAFSAAQESSRKAELKKMLAPYYTPPAAFAGKFGDYASPLVPKTGAAITTKAQWESRRAELLALWHKRLGPWPELLKKPKLTTLETTPHDGFTQRHVQVQVSPHGHTADGYLLIPAGKGPFPAALVPFYEPLTSIGQGKSGRGTHDYGLQLVKRGFVTLSIGTPGSIDRLAAKEGEPQQHQPLTLLAYAAANCHTALTQLAEVDPARIGIIGLSYGGKWSMFASCLYEKFACAVWSDPGIVFDEKNGNVNYWEPWYLGFDPGQKRKPGIPSESNPRTGLYKVLREQGVDLVELHALTAPRPVLVSGGTEDPPRNWQALNHLVKLNEVLGVKERVALTSRQGHIPTAAALDLEMAFLEYWLT